MSKLGVLDKARTMFVDLQIGDILTFRNADGSAVTITVLLKHGRRSRLSLSVPDDVRVEHPGRDGPARMTKPQAIQGA